MSQLSPSEARLLARTQRELLTARQSGDPAELAAAQARLQDLQQDLYEGDDDE